MRDKKKIISTVISAAVILSCLPSVSLASDDPFDEDAVRTSATELQYGNFNLIFDSTAESRDQFYYFDCQVSGYYELVSNACDYMITPEITVFDDNFQVIESGVELNTDEDSPPDYDYVFEAEEGEIYYFRMETFSENTMGDYIVCFFPSIAPADESDPVYLEIGADLTIESIVADYDDAHPEYYDYRWEDSDGNVIGNTDTLTCSVTDNDYVFLFYTYRSCIATRRCYDYLIDNNLECFIQEDDHYLLTSKGGSVTIHTSTTAINNTGIQYEWSLETDGAHNSIGSGSTLNLTGVNGSDVYRFTVFDVYGNEDYCRAAVFVDDPATNIEFAANNPYSFTFSDTDLCRVFTITPEVSGSYDFHSTGSGDLYCALFDGEYDLMGEADDIDEYDYNFEISADLEAGKTYFLCVSGYLDTENPATSEVITMTTPTPIPASSGSGSSSGSSGSSSSSGSTGSSSATTSAPTAAPVTNTPAASTPASTPATTPASTPAATPSAATPVPTTAPAASETGIAGFVERLYTVALGRPSDPAGKQDWIDAVTLRGCSGGDVARGFLFSSEFLNKDVTNVEFATVLYRTFFDREPDQAGLNGWVNVLDNGVSKQDVIEGFINSTEWANLCLRFGISSGGTGVPNVDIEPNEATIAFATRLYTTCLGRDADPSGLMAWARQLANQRETGTGAARGFFFSSEFINQNVSNGEYVSRLYRTFMGREPDAGGFIAWKTQLDNGVSREEVFEGFAQSPEFTQICASYGIIR